MHMRTRTQGTRGRSVAFCDRRLTFDVGVEAAGVAKSEIQRDQDRDRAERGSRREEERRDETREKREERRPLDSSSEARARVCVRTLIFAGTCPIYREDRVETGRAEQRGPKTDERKRGMDGYMPNRTGPSRCSSSSWVSEGEGEGAGGEGSCVELARVGR